MSDEAKDAAWLKETQATLADLQAEAGYLASINAVQEATISRLKEARDILERNAAIQAKLLADTGRERDELKHDIDRHLQIISEMLAERGRLTEANEGLRKALEMISQGDEPRPLGKRYRDDGTPSKHDQCTHGSWMYEDCGSCICEFATAALATNSDSDAQS